MPIIWWLRPPGGLKIFTVEGGKVLSPPPIVDNTEIIFKREKATTLLLLCRFERFTTAIEL